MDSIFVFLNGEQQGPYSREQIGELLAQKTVGPATLAWQEGLPDWVPVLTLLSPEASAALAENTIVTQTDRELQPVSQNTEFAAEVRELSAGQKLFGRYELVRLIGRGGMGLVWLAKDETLGEEIALKFLPETVRLDPLALEELKRETRRSRKLSHWNIVKVHDFCSDGNAAGISMEFIDGDTLSGLRARQPHLCFAVSEIGQWTQQLVNALGYAHEQARVVHRDLKPANIMITREGNVKITDFGIASSIAENISRVTIQRGSSGTLAYMSPQQAMGRAPSPQDDIYSFGAMLFELLTSKPPFFRGDILAQVSGIMPATLAERRAELEIAGAAIPENWEDTISACLAKQPEERPQSMAEVGVRLGLETAIVPRVAMQPATAIPTAITPAATTPITVEAVPVESRALDFPAARRHPRRLLIGALVAVVLLLLAGGCLYYFKGMLPARQPLAQQNTSGATGSAPAPDSNDSLDLPTLRAKAESGDVVAERDLARRYDLGDGVPKDPKENLKWLQKAAEGGDVLAQVWLGMDYKTGWVGVRDASKAVTWLRKAADQGNAQAEVNLGEMYAGGDGVAQDYGQALAWYKKASDRGGGDGTYANADIGELYQSGDGMPRDYTQAMLWFKKGADLGDARAQCNLAFMYLNGLGVTKDYAQAFSWFKKAADLGNPDAACGIGSMYENGWGVAQDWKQALTWYQKAADKSSDAQYGIGNFYLQGTTGLQDFGKAMTWFRKAADQGNVKALVAIGDIYADGLGVKRDRQEANIWYQKAADKGDAGSQGSIGQSYADGTYGFPQDIAKAFYWLTKSANQGDAGAEWHLGDMYLQGQGTPRDYDQAFAWYQKSADQGNSYGQCALGTMYLNGWGTVKDSAQALALFKKAGENDNAQYAIGRMYLTGDGVPQDYGQALTWFQSTLKDGNEGGAVVSAEDALGTMYENGWGVPKDVKTAADWYQKAAVGKYPGAEAALKRLGITPAK